MKNNSRDIELEKQIDAYVKGHLTDDEAHRLWIRLLKNPDYIELLETELHIKSIIEEETSQSKTAAPIQITFLKNSWRWAAAAASIGILVVALNFLIDSSSNAIQPLALSSINIVEHMASPEIVRAEKSDLSEADSMLNNGFKAAISGQLGESMQIYNTVINEYPGDTTALAQAHFNTGIIYYNNAGFNKAITAFDQSLKMSEEDPVLDEKARWFLANAYIHLEEFEKARAAIRQVYDLDGIYREAAARLISRLDELPDSTESNDSG